MASGPEERLSQEDLARAQRDLARAQQAAFVALAGGLRVPFGRTRTRQLSVGANPTRLTANRTADAVLYLELRAIAGEPAVSFIVGPTSDIASGANPEYSFPAESPARFVVYPGEALFARVTAGDAAVTVNEVRV